MHPFDGATDVPRTPCRIFPATWENFRSRSHPSSFLTANLWPPLSKSPARPLLSLLENFTDVETTMSDARNAVHVRIQAEYREMPGLSLTLPQAARLFNLELRHCASVLDTLVADGHLWTNGREFLSSSVGRRCA